MLLHVNLVLASMLFHDPPHLARRGSGELQRVRNVGPPAAALAGGTRGRRRDVVLEDGEPQAPQWRRRRGAAATAAPTATIACLRPLQHHHGPPVVQDAAVARGAEEREEAAAVLELVAAATLRHTVRADAEREAGLLKEALRDVLAKRHGHAAARGRPRAWAVVGVGPLRIEDDLLLLAPANASGELLLGEGVRVVPPPSCLRQ
mmetsp:Transcript_10172/g.28764  ORF Transcript_10172/g.28764 Transcript_10172/m.28764 type:complete len:205 (+) Transcript_10172:1164-1778(+)